MDDANVTNKLQTTKRFCNFFVAANRLRQKESASITIQSHFKERANAPQTSTLSMGNEKTRAYESSPGSIFGRCVKAF